MTKKEEKIKKFNPCENINRSYNIFGLPFNASESKVILIPVPWDVTVSNSDGASKAPEAIFEASFQIDLYDEFIEDAWKIGISMEYTPEYWFDKNKKLRVKAEEFINYLENKLNEKSLKRLKQIRRNVNEINHECEMLMRWVKDVSTDFLKQEKIVGVVGGDHSTSLGLLQSLAEKNEEFGILQIDAHADLRRNYQHFRYSHASAMYNALAIPQVKKIVQLGIRDFCEEEMDRINKSKGRIVSFTDRTLKNQQFNGKSWHELAQEIIEQLPKNIYVSFDIDGLDPSLCPNSGTPVPGGFQFNEIFYLLELLIKNKKRIIGFDLCEVAPGDNGWDAYVGAKALYKLAIIAAKSN